MGQETWSRVDAWMESTLLAKDPILEHVLASSVALGLPAIHVSPMQGRMLQLLAMAMGARRILEIGTLAGYSTIWLARALPPGGSLVTLEIDPARATVARANMRHAGLDERVDVRLGPAVTSLRDLEREATPPFDMCFIDADKASCVTYVESAARLSRSGALIVVDNVIREGRVLEGSSRDESVQGIRQLVDLLGSDPRFRSTAIQTVGEKGYDGFALILVA